MSVAAETRHLKQRISELYFNEGLSYREIAYELDLRPAQVIPFINETQMELAQDFTNFFNPVLLKWHFSDTFWNNVEPLIPARLKFSPLNGRPRNDIKEMMTGVFYVIETGCTFDQLPKEYGAGRTAHKYFLALRQINYFYDLWHKNLLTIHITPEVLRGDALQVAPKYHQKYYIYSDTPCPQKLTKWMRNKRAKNYHADYKWRGIIRTKPRPKKVVDN